MQGTQQPVSHQSIPPRRLFDPLAHELDSSFRLTKLSDLKGCGCKVPQSVLSKLLGDIFPGCKSGAEGDQAAASVQNDDGINLLLSLDSNGTQRPTWNLALSDSTVTPLKCNSDLMLIQSSDFLYPLIDDPYVMGKIACASVLSNLNAYGVTEVDSLQLILGISSRITQKERDVIVPFLIRGFKDAAHEAGISIEGGQTLVNPWMLMGGIATAVMPRSEVILPNNANVSDVLVLTKPLGTHIATTAHLWMNDDKDRWARIKGVITEEECKKAYQRAMASMHRLNRKAAELMRKYNAHGATQVAGYGLLGHAQALARAQTNPVDFVIHNLPVIAKMAAINKVVGNVFNLTNGLAPETSGGLLIIFPREEGAAFAKSMEAEDHIQAWIIGVVAKGTRNARVIDKPRVIEVPAKESPDKLF